MSGTEARELRQGSLGRDRAIDRAADSRPIPGNRVVLLQDGPEVYDAMFEVIAGARRFIHFENYIIRADRTGRRFADALMARARAGLPVRVLYDWLGCLGTPRRYWRALRAAGCEVRAFNRFQPLRPLRAINRDHRKLVVADGTHSVMGGLCIGDDWAGDPARDIPPWRDTGVLIEGPATTALDLAFARVWALAGGRLPEEEREADAPPAGDTAIRVVAGEPRRQRTFRVLEYLTAGAGRRLWIVDAYLLPPARLFEVMTLAARDGVDIRMLVPSASDVPIVRNLTQLGYRRMLQAGIRVFEWNGPMMHAKTTVADSVWTRIGTSNINASSLIGNFELDVVIEDRELAMAMEQQFRRDIAASIEVVQQPRRAPRALQRMVPSRLTPVEGTECVPRHRSGREFRNRAVIGVRRLMNAAFRSLFGPASVVLVVVAALFLLFPRVMGIGFGLFCLWVAIAAGIQAWWERTP
jgi:cardiolipin synthase